MVGRAGRPQFDTSGVAVVMTQTAAKARYQGLVSGAAPVESCLLGSLAEHLVRRGGVCGCVCVCVCVRVRRVCALTETKTSDEALEAHPPSPPET